uniref:Secreted protein n=1 Tax=Ascaris lumbricoides TaxID=6252 RepID=A0A0M3HWE9_ASCLU
MVLLCALSTMRKLAVDRSGKCALSDWRSLCMSIGDRRPRVVANGPIICFRLRCLLATLCANYQPSATLIDASSTQASFLASTDCARCHSIVHTPQLGAHPYDRTDLRLSRLPSSR